MDKFVELLARFLAVLVIICTHEYAHAYVANKCGDPTARFSGRLTLNPLAHFDPIGIVMFALIGFGWAKPVPINPNNFRNYKRGCLLTSSAGVIVNYLTAFLIYPIFILVLNFVVPVFSGKYIATFLVDLFYFLVVYSLSFCVFNLLPFYPLDGFRIVDSLNKKRGNFFWFLREHGHKILLGMILVSALADKIWILKYFDVLGFILDIAISIFGKPITLFWNWLFEIFSIGVPVIF